MVDKIFWNEPKFGTKELELVKEVLESGYVSEGHKTKELEKRLAKICGTKHVIMTTSCTAALYLAIESDKTIRGYSSGEVMIPDLNFVAVLNAIKMAGLEPKIMDVDKDDYCLKSQFWERLTVTVNLLGRSATDEFFNSVGGDDSCLICDNAGALGSDVPNGKVGCYSLQGNKIISCGQGGFCATDDDEYAKVIREIKDFGRNRKEDNDTTGFNFKFNDILAAVTLGQLELLEERKQLLVYQYTGYKKDLKKYGKFMKYDDGEIPLWVEFFPKGSRDDLIEFLKENGIDCRIPWRPFKGLPNSKYYFKNCMWLPNGNGVSESDQNKVIKKIKEFYGIK